jgi:uncharacterized protein
MKIGVISDTHGYFDPKLPGLFNGVEHILHGGDVGYPSIIQKLEEIAPVTAVLGNTDDPGFGWRELEVVELGGVAFLVHHIVDPRFLTDRLRQAVDRHDPHMVVFGHTHKPFDDRVGGRRYFNPGYAGKPRSGVERSVAVLEAAHGRVTARFHALGPVGE